MTEQPTPNNHPTTPGPEPVRGISPLEAAQLATSSGALPGRPWGLPKMAARFDALVIGLILLVSLVSYANLFHADLLSDARLMLQSDPRIHDLDHLEDIFGKNYGYPLNTADGRYRPLTTLSYLFNYTILGNGMGAVGYRTVNWTLHVFNAILLFYLVSVLFRSARSGLAAAILFAVHPVNSEAVSNLMGRPDLLMTTLVLLGLLAHIGQISYGNYPGRMWTLRLSLWLLFLLALLAKESALVLLALVFLFDRLFDWRRYTGDPRRDYWENFSRKFRGNYLGLLAMLGIYLTLRGFALMRLEPQAILSVDNPLAEAGLISRILTASTLVFRSLYTLLFPRTLSTDYSYNQIPVINGEFHHFADWLGVLALIGLVGMIWAIWRSRRRQRPVSFWGLMFLLALAPELSLFGANDSLFSELFLYLPSLAVCTFLGIGLHLATRTISAPAWALKGQLPPFADLSETALLNEHLDAAFVNRFRRQQQAGWALYGLIIATLVGTFAVRTFTQNSERETDLMIWQNAVANCPESAKAHKQYAWAIFQNAPNGSRIDESILQAEKAIILCPEYDDAYAQLGHYCGVKADLMAGRDRAAGKELSTETRTAYLKAAEILQKAADLNRKASDSRLQRLMSRSWARDLKLVLGNQLIYIDLGMVYAQLHDYTKAQQAFTSATRISPGDPTAHEGLGESLANMGQLQEGAVELIQALMLSPNRPQAWSALEIVYRTLLPNQQAILRDASGQPHLNTANTAVELNIHRAFRSLVQALRDANQIDQARRLAEIAVDQYAMPQVDFGDLIRREVKRAPVQ